MTQKMNKFNSLKKTTKVDFATYLGVIVVFIITTILQNNGSLKRSAIGLLVPICCYMSMAVSLNLTVGILGELSLGHAGFMSVGAFSGIVMAMWLSKGMGVANETLCLLLAILTGGAAGKRVHALAGSGFIQPFEGLVQHQQRRIVQQRAGQGNAALHAPGQLAHCAAQRVRQIQLI